MPHTGSPPPRLATSPYAGAWLLDPHTTFLNHGSFGACPKEVLEFQRRLRDQMEQDPPRFMTRELEPMLDAARTSLAAFVGAPPECLAFVRNATEGVNSVLNCLALEDGDEILTTDHEYNACLNALRALPERRGTNVRIVTASIPFPIQSADAAFDAIMECVTSRTRFALISHVTSPTSLILPVERLVPALAARGIETLVDGAHAPGMIPLRLSELNAAFYTGNCHKWMCAPKGAGFLCVREDLRGRIRPLSISHGANSPRTDRSKFRLEFDWTGTADPTPLLCVPEAIRVLKAMVPGGWESIRRINHETALAGRRAVCEALGSAPPAPDLMIGSMATVALPDGGAPVAPAWRRMYDEFRIQIPLMEWPLHAPKPFVRLSAHLYNHAGQYELLAAALRSFLSR